MGLEMKILWRCVCMCMYISYLAFLPSLGKIYSRNTHQNLSVGMWTGLLRTKKKGTFSFHINAFLTFYNMWWVHVLSININIIFKRSTVNRPHRTHQSRSLTITKPFLLRVLSILKFWQLWGSLEPIPCEYWWTTVILWDSKWNFLLLANLCLMFFILGRLGRTWIS